jgi:hypothetical protein
MLSDAIIGNQSISSSIYNRTGSLESYSQVQVGSYFDDIVTKILRRFNAIRRSSLWHLMSYGSNFLIIQPSRLVSLGSEFLSFNSSKKIKEKS